MRFERITDRQLLAAYFRRNDHLHFYSLGDLDDFFWPRAACFGVTTAGQLSRVVLFYRGAGLPVLLAFGPEGFLDEQDLRELVEILPATFYAHLSPGLESEFARCYSMEEFGAHYKMALMDQDRLADISRASTCQLGKSDLPEIERLYQASYLDHSFEPRLLQTGKYFGSRMQGRLVSIAGVHVYSAAYRVAALGNIATHPDFRNQGLATRVTARLCRELADEVDFIGLNVKCANKPALKLYHDLGFKIRAKYAEFALKRRF